MPFDPEEIEQKDFLITLRGYDKDEVRAFLSTVAADYRDLVSSSGTAPAGSSNPFQALGEELGDVLQSAKQAAERMRKSAQEEVTALRRRAEEESSSLRQSAQAAAQRLTEEAERHAIEVRGAAENQARDQIMDMERRVEKLRSTEVKLRQRLYALETMLQSVRQDLELDEDEEGDLDTKGADPRPSAGFGGSASGSRPTAKSVAGGGPSDSADDDGPELEREKDASETSEESGAGL